MSVDTDLWTAASLDLEAEHAQLRLFEAQQRTADLWPFVALARSNEELGHRLAMIQDTLSERVPDPTLHTALIEGFTANFKVSFADDLNSDTGEDEAPDASTSGLIGDGSSQQDQDGTPDLTASLHVPLQIWHAAKRQWITITADASPNPAYFSGGPEEGPMTGQTGTYPVEVDGPDPWNPINGNMPLPPTNVIEPANRFPAEPQPWTVTPDKAWVENPMQFTQGPRAHATTATLRTFVGYGQPMVQVGPACQPDGRWYTLHQGGTPQSPRDGFQPEQSNPYYFDQGSVGLESEQSAGFPVDEALPEPDERVDMYQNPQSGAGGHGMPLPGDFGGPAVNMVIPPQYVTSAKNNVGACATCHRPVYREGSKWHHLDAHLKGDHNVMLDADHPWVQQMAHSSALRTATIRRVQGGYAVFVQGQQRTRPMTYSAALLVKEANQYIKKDGDQWVILQKGTGKILSHHDSEEKAQAAFAAMEMNKHSGARVATRSFFDLRKVAEGTDPTTANPFGQPAGTSPPMTMPAPNPPPTMSQGGPGAEAAPSMSSGGTPSAGSANVPQPGAKSGSSSAIPTTAVKVAAFFHVGEDMVRGRPTAESPTGVPDEYTANTWEGPLTTHPRQSPTARGVNTPQQPGSPIPQISSSDNPGQNERSAEQDDEDDED
jgi:hypothetical protein